MLQGSEAEELTVAAGELQVRIRRGHCTDWHDAEALPDSPGVESAGQQTEAPGKLTWPTVRPLVKGIVTVSDNEIRDTMRFLFERMKLVVEPSGASALAARRLPRLHATDPGWRARKRTVQVRGLPLAYVSGLVVERAFGLTKQSTPDWFAEQLKGLAVGTALQIPLMTSAFIVIRRRPNDWWLILAGATVPLMVLLSNLAPVLLMPLFNTFTPLSDERLREQLLALTERSGVKVADIYEMDMSRQSEKPNAMFTGLGNTKRIILGDTLLRCLLYTSPSPRDS